MTTTIVLMLPVLLPLRCGTVPTAVHTHAATNAVGIARTFEVKAFHAVGDGMHDDTSAIQQAIDACAAAGGGRVVFAKGTYCTGSIALQSHVTVEVPDGVVIQGSAEKADYPLATARWEGMEKPAYQALFTAKHAEQIAIVGKGIIQSDRQMGARRDPRGPTLIEPVECKDVTIDGPTLHTYRIWAVHPTYCENVRLSNLTIQNKGANGDGMDIDSCTKVSIDHCSFETDDDNLSIKSGKGQEGVRVGRPSEDVSISHCSFIKGYCSIAFGSELSGGIRNVRVEHCTFHVGRGALYLKSRPGRAGYIEDITADDLEAGPCPLLVIDMNYSFNVDTQGVPGVAGLTRFKNITVKNSRVVCTQAVKVVSTPDNPVDGVTLESISGTCAQAWIFTHAREVVLKNIRLTELKGKFLKLDDVQGTGLSEDAMENKN